jgi:hypothetical protein
MLNSGIIDLAIGIAFVFGVTAALSSVLTELIARFLGLRGAYLLLGLRELLDGKDTAVHLSSAETDYAAMKGLMSGHPAAQPGAAADAAAAATPGSATGALLGSPILRSQGMTGQISARSLTMPAVSDGSAPLPSGPRKDRRSLPSYIPARSFSAAMMNLLVPDGSGATTMAAMKKGIGAIPDSMGTLRGSLTSLVADAGNDADTFRTAVENWYDDHMDRVSGWYKRHVARITLAVGAVLVLLLNINTITIGRALYSDSAVRTAVSSVAARTTGCTGQSQQACLAQLQSHLASATQNSLPLGWATVAGCAASTVHCNWLERRGFWAPGAHGAAVWQLLLVLIGFLVTIVALTPGAQFWFGLLAKLGSLRSTGPPPAR